MNLIIYFRKVNKYQRQNRAPERINIKFISKKKKKSYLKIFTKIYTKIENKLNYSNLI